jgi:hypothetical protein
MNALRRGYDTAYRTGGPITLVMSPPKLCHVPGLTPGVWRRCTVPNFSYSRHMCLLFRECVALVLDTSLSGAIVGRELDIVSMERVATMSLASPAISSYFGVTMKGLIF